MFTSMESCAIIKDSPPTPPFPGGENIPLINIKYLDYENNIKIGLQSPYYILVINIVGKHFRSGYYSPPGKGGAGGESLSRPR